MPAPTSSPAQLARTHVNTWSRKSLLGLAGVSAADVRALLTATRAMAARLERRDFSVHELEGRTVATMFFEDSTRTKTSFTAAAQRLGAHVLDLSATTSSVNKGETLIDTAKTVEAMGVDAMIVRAKQAGAAGLIAAHVACPVINAGDGRHEHPTQGLIDLYTVAEAHGRLDSFDLSGLRLAIVGDVVSSRVARSAIAGFTALGAEVVCVGPPTMVPRGLAGLGGLGVGTTCRVEHELDRVIGACDAVMMLRIQFERHEGGGGGGASESGSSGASGGSVHAGDKSARGPVIASVREYREFFGMTVERAARLKAGAVVLHPGPMNRGIEIDGAVADGPRSRVTRQVRLGVAVRMGVLGQVAG